MSHQSRGVYFLANDTYLEWAIALLESIRAWNPDLPLCLIPFDERADRLIGLTSTYAFSVWDDSSLQDLDAMGLNGPLDLVQFM